MLSVTKRSNSRNTSFVFALIIVMFPAIAFLFLKNAYGLFGWLILLVTVLLMIYMLTIISAQIFFLSKTVVSILIVVSILFPYIRLPHNMPDLRIEFLIAIVVWSFLFIRALTGDKKIVIYKNKIFLWFFIFMIIILTSMLYASLFKGSILIIRDFWEPIKLLLYVSIFALVSSLGLKKEEIAYYYKLSILVFILSALVGFLQYMNIMNINELVTPYFAPTQMRGLLVHGRIVGTSPNPNEFGGIMVLASSLSLSGILFMSNIKLRNLCWVALPVFIFAISLTLSRTALVSLVLSLLTILLLYFKQVNINNKLFRFILTASVGLIFIAILLQVVPEKALFRFGQIFTFSEATSFQARLNNWETHFIIWKESPWLGWGPGKETMGTIVDNEYLLILRRYGVIGLSAFLCLFGAFFLGLSRIRKASIDASTSALTTGLQGSLFGYIFYMSLSSLYHSLQLMPMMLIFIGLAFSQYNNIRYKS